MNPRPHGETEAENCQSQTDNETGSENCRQTRSSEQRKKSDDHENNHEQTITKRLSRNRTRGPNRCQKPYEGPYAPNETQRIERPEHASLLEHLKNRRELLLDVQKCFR